MNRRPKSSCPIGADGSGPGGFGPLRFVPRSKTAILGLVTSKAGALKPAAGLQRHLGEAAAYVDPQQLCLSPQCGFASTEEGNFPSEDE